MPEPDAQPDPTSSLTREQVLTSASRPAPTPEGEEPADAQGFAVEVTRLLVDLKCTDPVIFDVRGLSPVTDYVVVLSGTSDRQILAVANHASELGKKQGFPRLGEDADKATTWLVLDFVEVMVHLFEPGTRAHYDLEMLWGDAPRVSWHRG